MISREPVENALNNLASALELHLATQNDGFASEVASSLAASHIECSPAATRDIGKNPITHVIAAGGSYPRSFPAIENDAGREAARLFYTTVRQALPEVDWKMKNSISKEVNPNRPDDGRVCIDINEQSAGLFARNLNSIAEEIREDRASGKLLAKSMNLCGEFGPRLQRECIAKLETRLIPDKDGHRQIAIYVRINANHPDLQQNLIKAGFNNLGDITISPRNNTDVDLPAVLMSRVVSNESLPLIKRVFENVANQERGRANNGISL